MNDLGTHYLGLHLKSPIIVGSSPITSSLKFIKDAEIAGAGAIVLKTTFEEQLIIDSGKVFNQDKMLFHYPESLSNFVNYSKSHFIEEQLDLLKECKDNLHIPVIASIHCINHSVWTDFAAKFEELGADAIELNYAVSPMSDVHGTDEIESNLIKIIESVKEVVGIPISVKLSPYYSNMKNLLHRIDETGTEGIVLFNRYLQPDININNLSINHDNYLSNPSEATYPLRWVALMSKLVKSDLCITTGIHDYSGVVKSLLVGAKAVQVCSVLYKNGIDYINVMNDELNNWMVSKGLQNIHAVSVMLNDNHEFTPEFDRIQYMKRNIEKQL